MKNILLSLFAILLLNGALAQDSTYQFRNDIKVSLFPLFTHTTIFTYERAFPHRQTIETDLGLNVIPIYLFPGNSGQPLLTVNNRHFAALQIGYKYMLHIDDEQKIDQSAEGFLVSGCYLKARLNYTRMWRSYDCFVGNEGHTIITEERTFHENDLNLAFILGYQHVGHSGIMVDFFGGYNKPLLYAGPFRNTENPGYCGTHWNNFTGGFMIGWAF